MVSAIIVTCFVTLHCDEQAVYKYTSGLYLENVSGFYISIWGGKINELHNVRGWGPGVFSCMRITSVVQSSNLPGPLYSMRK